MVGENNSDAQKWGYSGFWKVTFRETTDFGIRPKNLEIGRVHLPQYRCAFPFLYLVSVDLRHGSDQKTYRSRV